MAYRNYLVEYIAGAIGSADLVAYFFLRSFRLIKNNGLFGLVASNSIAEGDTRKIGLERLLKQKGTIITADTNIPWPGIAAVFISQIFMFKGNEWKGRYTLNKEQVSHISAFLSAQEEWTPKTLKINKDQSFIGSYVLGMGFTMNEEKALSYIQKNAKNKEVLFPYINGDDFNSSPEQTTFRWIINFWDWPLNRIAEGCWKDLTEDQKEQFIKGGSVPNDYPFMVANDFPDLLEIIRNEVKPEREKNRLATYREIWWQFAAKRYGLYHSIGMWKNFYKHPVKSEVINPTKDDMVLAVSRYTRHFVPSLVPNKYVFSDSLVIFKPRCPNLFLSSTIFQDWCWKQGSRLGSTTLRVTPSDCFDSYPFPEKYAPCISNLETSFYELRREIMTTEQIGLTDLYNRFHNPEVSDERIERLRAYQRELDEGVKTSYDWDDLSLNHGFHKVGYLVDGDDVRYTICEETRVEILRRLSLLNKARWEEEQGRALSKKGRRKTK